MEFSSLSAAILAGGKGERMACQDKGLVLYQGLPMVLLVSKALLKVVDLVFVNANRNLEQYASLGFEVVKDSADCQGKGPLCGLLACLDRTATSHLLVSPCDTPCISGEAFKQLKQASQQQPDKIHYLRDSNGLHPLHAVLPVEACVNALKAFLDSSRGYSVMAFYEAYGCHPVVWEKSSELLNINTSEYLKS
ncbi:molybdenum cofactor guanylyltransferase [Marinomonas transparens]|uniref:Molybdenum cofactor guanylyltransferase n=1 Tax=Marinomonas transparens TaxID=2795388 RepID=A0A934JQZ2_9GAMM|nr:molybdenum cofactor guanylyltransferase [Marinomonas transparens]MBJ7538454.1 molybdenum cofactor guanylyltransferase [Marinomonas transparens]